MIKAIVFDCFGVILTDALSAICDNLANDDPGGVQEIRSLVHAANKGIIEPSESTARVAEILGIGLEEYRTQIREGEIRDQKLLDYIKTLRSRYKTAMLSNITKGGLERRFPGGELSQYFDVVVASGEIGFAKPDREAYEITAQRLGLTPCECFFTDDRQPYCDAAVTAGMSAALYTGFSQFQNDLHQVLTGANQLQ